MNLAGEHILLRVYLRNTDAFGWRPAADALVERARSEGLAGATALRGRFGLDFDGKLLESHAWSLVEHVPMIVEIVDSPAKIGRFLGIVAEILPAGVVTLERAHGRVYRKNDSGLAAPRLSAADMPDAVLDLLNQLAAAESPLMKLAENGQLLRIFVGESDSWNGQPLARAIVLKARELGLAGATVLHGSMGFGANSRVHTERLLSLSTDLPVIIEIVDSADKIETLLPFLDEAVREGLVTIENVRVLKYRHAKSD